MIVNPARSPALRHHFSDMQQQREVSEMGI
jgi:hypothetical protein